MVTTPPAGGMSDIDSEAGGSSDDSAELVDAQDGDWDWGEQESSATRCLCTPMHDSCAVPLVRPRASQCAQPIVPALCQGECCRWPRVFWVVLSVSANI